MALAGKEGRLDWGSTAAGAGEVADLREWSLSVDRDLFDIATFGSSGWREFQQNLNGASGSMSGYWNVTSSTAMSDVQGNILNQSGAATVELHVNGSGDGYTGSAFITGLSPSAAVDGIVTFAADFTFTGAVSYSTTLST